MDFFARQDKARRATKWLILYFILAIAAITGAIYIALVLALDRPRWDAELFLGVAAGTLTVILTGSAYKTLALRSGGAAVAEMLGGEPLDANSPDPDARKLLNVVEEMSIASGVPVPQVYLLKEEEGINAFAAGHSIDNAVIGVTSGAMRLLTRDELQGVIAHEYSHILNGDMRLNVRLIGLVHGIFCLYVIGRILLRSSGRRSRDKNANALPILGLALIVIGSIGILFGRLIKSGVSRQREYLADASAVQFTRNPRGLASALMKIGGLGQGSQVKNEHAEEASHLFFANGLAQSLSSLFATHPPLTERIKALDPGFDGQFVPTRETEPQRGPSIGHAEPIPMPKAFHAENVAPLVGTMGPQHIEYATAIKGSIPPRLIEAAHEPLGATAVIYGLLLSNEAGARAEQLAQLKSVAAEFEFAEAQKVMGETRSLPTEGRLPLVSMTLPALGRLSPPQFERFAAGMKLLIEADREVNLFEYALQKLVRRHLEPQFRPVPPPLTQYYALAPLEADCVQILSALAQTGHCEPGAAEAAFRAGLKILGFSQAATLLPIDQCGLDRIDAALNKLAQASPAIKKALIKAAAQTVATDGIVHPEEAELLRAVADTLDCPLPPFVENLSGRMVQDGMR